MNDLKDTGPAFLEMAHRIVWASAATVDAKGRPRSRVLHPIWQWDGEGPENAGAHASALPGDSSSHAP